MVAQPDGSESAETLTALRGPTPIRTYPMLKATETVYVLESGDWSYRDSEGNPMLGLSLPMDDHLIAAVERIESEFDSLTCESYACTGRIEATGGYPNAVGWGLHESEGPHGEEITHSDFSYTAIVVTPTGAWLMCEDCHCTDEFTPGGAAHQRLKEGA